MKAEQNYIEACKMIPEDYEDFEFATIHIDYLHEMLLRSAGLGWFDKQIFPIGTKLTSKENGELIEAPKGTPDELIVGIVI